MPPDDWDPEALPAAYTDPDIAAATTEGQEQFRKARLEHVADVEANRPTADADPHRQGAFEQKPDVQDQQIELWAYKALAAFDANEGVADWPQFTRINELPEVWVNTLVKPRYEELRARRGEPGVHPGLFDRTEDLPPREIVVDSFQKQEVQLEGGVREGAGAPATGETGHVDRGPVPSEQAIAAREPEPIEPGSPREAVAEQAQQALTKALERIALGENVDAELIGRLERLAGL